MARIRPATTVAQLTTSFSDSRDFIGQHIFATSILKGLQRMHLSAGRRHIQDPLAYGVFSPACNTCSQSTLRNIQEGTHCSVQAIATYDRAASRHRHERRSQSHRHPEAAGQFAAGTALTPTGSTRSRLYLSPRVVPAAVELFIRAAKSPCRFWQGLEVTWWAG